MMYDNFIKETNININGLKLRLKSTYSDTGPYFSISNNIEPIANLSTETYGKECSFSINITNARYKRRGIGTFLMKELFKWAKHHKIPYVYGIVSPTPNENKNIPIMFYQNLYTKTRKIKNFGFIHNSIFDGIYELKNTKEIKSFLNQHKCDVNDLLEQDFYNVTIIYLF